MLERTKRDTSRRRRIFGLAAAFSRRRRETRETKQARGGTSCTSKTQRWQKILRTDSRRPVRAASACSNGQSATLRVAVESLDWLQPFRVAVARPGKRTRPEAARVARAKTSAGRSTVLPDWIKFPGRV